MSGETEYIGEQNWLAKGASNLFPILEQEVHPNLTMNCLPVDQYPESLPRRLIGSAPRGTRELTVLPPQPFAWCVIPYPGALLLSRNLRLYKILT